MFTAPPFSPQAIANALPFGDVAWLSATFYLSFSSLGFHLPGIKANYHGHMKRWAFMTSIAFAWPILRVYVI